MIGGLILVALAWGASAIIKATILRGPTSFPKALGIGIITVIPLVTILPPSQAGTFSGALSVFLWLGYSARTQREIRSYLIKNSDYESTVKPEKKEPFKPEKPTMSSAHDDEKFYEQVASELETGNIKKGLWLKAETEADGNQFKTKQLYTKWRISQLTTEVDEANQSKAREELTGTEAQARQERNAAQDLLKREEARRLDAIQKAGNILNSYAPLLTSKEISDCLSYLQSPKEKYTAYLNKDNWEVYINRNFYCVVSPKNFVKFVKDEMKKKGIDLPQ